MKNPLIKAPLALTLLSALACATPVVAQSASTGTFTNFLRQVQYPGGIIYDVDVDSAGQRLSLMPIDPGGARFELWTVYSEGPTSYLIGANYVGTYIPLGTLNLRTGDETGALNRTRADQPFYLDLTVEGLRSGDEDPVPSKSLDFLWHVQSYGEKGTGEDIDRSQATLVQQSSITTNGTETLTFELNSIPGDDRSKVRGEERFSLYSLADYQAPSSQLASETVQIWPVADGSISGINQGDLVRYELPQLTFTANDLYPLSTTYAQAYKGNPALNTEGTVIPGSALVLNEAAAQDRVLVVSDYSEALGADGVWTIELLTKTPFGIDRLAYVSFNLDRTMKVNGDFTTIE